MIVRLCNTELKCHDLICLLQQEHFYIHHSTNFLHSTHLLALKETWSLKVNVIIYCCFERIVVGMN